MTPGLTLDVEHSVGALDGRWDALFATAGLQSGSAWLAATADAALPAGSRACLVAVREGGRPLALFPMREDGEGGWASLTTPYSCLYQPLFRPDAPATARLGAATLFARYCRRFPVTRLEALDPDWPGLAELRAGFRAAGLLPRAFTHFVNWHTDVPGPSWDAYLAARPGALRETVRRRTRAAARAGDVRTELARTGAAFAPALAAYEAIYARSWKEPEPFPRFNGALVAGLAESGALRIATMWQGDTPIAAQIWTVADRCGTVLKLAHDEAHKALSPGTVLTAAAIRELIERDGVTSLDFGRGDDGYKRAWAGSRRERVGLLALNGRTVAGLAALARHDGGRAWRALERRWRPSRANAAVIDATG